MNKMIKALISVLLIGMIAFPATVFAGFSGIDTTDAAIDNDDETVTFTIYTDNTVKVDDVIVTATNTADSMSATTQVDITKDLPGNEVTATFAVKQLGINNDIKNYTIELWVDINDDTVQTANELANVEVVVTEANPVPRAELLDDELINEIDLEEDELTFGDEIEFEVEFNELATNEVVENAYFKVALYDGTEKLAGWIESKDDNIRFEDDDEVTFDQDDLRTTIAIPSIDDVDMNGDEKILTLEIEVYGDYLYEGTDYNQHLLDTAIEFITVEKLDDHMSIDTVSIEQQGNVLYTAITVENDGEENQKDVRAIIEIDALNVKQTSNRVTVYEDEDATIYIPVVLPAFASGEYDIEITVYNDDVSAKTEIEEVELTGIVGPQSEAGVVIGIDAATKTVSENGAVYAITFTNNGQTARTFTLETAGAEWGQTSVNPATVVVGASASEIASIFVAPNAGETGIRQFTVFVKEGAQIVKTVGLTANVEGSSVTGNTVAGFELNDLVDSGLKWVAAILVVVLIVLFVMWSWNKDEEEEL
jgi:hypothetical protein